MKTKEDIVNNWLPRYTGVPLTEFGQYILLTNFSNYVYMFAEQFGCEVRGLDKPMQTATANGITIINFGMGSPMAATVMDLLSAIKPKAALFLGEVRRPEKDQSRRFGAAHRCHSRRRYFR